MNTFQDSVTSGPICQKKLTKKELARIAAAERREAKQKARLEKPFRVMSTIYPRNVGESGWGDGCVRLNPLSPVGTEDEPFILSSAEMGLYEHFRFDQHEDPQDPLHQLITSEEDQEYDRLYHLLFGGPEEHVMEEAFLRDSRKPLFTLNIVNSTHIPVRRANRARNKHHPAELKLAFAE